MTDYTSLIETLQTKRQELITELSAIAVFNEETGDWRPKPDTEEASDSDGNLEADGVEESDERQATVAQLETLYRNVERALGNIATDTYGICEVCGAPIETDRLAVNPTARTCKLHMDDERTLPL